VIGFWSTEGIPWAVTLYTHSTWSSQDQVLLSLLPGLHDWLGHLPNFQSLCWAASTILPQLVSRIVNYDRYSIHQTCRRFPPAWCTWGVMGSWHR
jgi:hypothetical protein